MDIHKNVYVRVLVWSDNARRQARNINYAPERVHIFPYLTNNLFVTYAIADPGGRTRRAP